MGEQRDHLLSTDPGLVERALLFCVPFAVQMPADLLDGLEALIDDPGWDAKALSDYYDLVFDMAIARELAWARRANSVPAVLCDALEQAPGRSPAEVAQLWLRTAEALGTDGLDATFERLEQDHPTLLGAWSRHELTMTTVAISKGAVVPDLAQWRKRYQTSFECDAKARRTGELRKFGVLLLALIPLLPYLKIFALLLAIGWMYAIFKVFPSLGPDALAASRLAVLHAEPIEPLFELASAHGLFPRELASQLVPTKSFPLGRVLLEDAHPVFQLDRSDTALLRCIRPAHVERLR